MQSPWPSALLTAATTWLVAAAGLPAECGPAPDVETVRVEDQSSGEVFRVQIDVRFKGPVSLEGLEALACRELESRLALRALHVLEIRAWGAGADPQRDPEVKAVWAPEGRPEAASRYKPGDLSRHMLRLERGGKTVRRIDGFGTGEANVAAAAAAAAVSSVRPPAAAPAGKASASTMADVLTVVERWRQAWEGKQLERYLSFYAPDFRSDRHDLASWSRHKAQVFADAGEVAVQIQDPRVQMAGDRAVVTFVQRYSSDQHSDVGTKTLFLEKREGFYKIVRETWEPLS